MFWLYIIQAIFWYLILVRRSKDILNPFAVSTIIWLGCAGISQWQISDLITKWEFETHITVHACAYSIILCGLIFSDKEYKFHYKVTDSVFTSKFRILGIAFFLISLSCAIYEWKINDFIVPILSDTSSGDLKSELQAVSGIHYGTICFPYFSLVAFYEILFNRKSNKFFAGLVIAVTLGYTLFVQVSRGDLLIILLGMLLLFHAKYQIRVKYLAVLGGGLLLIMCLFMLVRVRNSQSLVYTAVEGNPYFSSIFMYIATGFENLNSLVKHGSPYTVIYATILKPILDVARLKMNIEFLNFEVVFFNAKPIAYSFYHDLGIAGVIIYTFVIYSIVGFIYKRAKYDRRYLLLLAALQKSIYVIFFGNYFTGTVGTSFPFVIIGILAFSMRRSRRRNIRCSQQPNIKMLSLCTKI